MNGVRLAAARFHAVVEAATPPSAGRTLAFRRIEEAVMWANKSVILGEKTNIR